METLKFIIRDREAGNVIDSFNTLQEAKQALISFELEDKNSGVYEDDFYEITRKD